MRLTSTAPVRAHLAVLRGHGLGTRRVARQAGLSRTAVEGAHRNALMYPHTAAAILAVKPEPLVKSHQVNGVGTGRRMHGLVALGWSYQRQADMAGLAMNVYRRSATRTLVLRRTAETVRRIYDELSMTRPAHRGAQWCRESGRRFGYFPPLAWDDETIDDPDALPCLLPPVELVDRDLELLVQHIIAGHQVEVTRPAQFEIVRRLPCMPRRQLAELAQCSPGYVDQLRRKDASC